MVDPWIAFSVQNIFDGFLGQLELPHSNVAHTVINTNENSYEGIGVLATTLQGPLWTWNFEGIRLEEIKNIEIKQNGPVLEVNYISNEDIFPKIESISYLDPEYNEYTVDDWDKLPSPTASPYLTNMELKENGYIDTQYTLGQLDVTVTGVVPGTAPPVVATYIGVFGISVFINLTKNVEKFMEEIDKRS